MHAIRDYHPDRAPSGDEFIDWRWFSNEITKILTSIYEINHKSTVPTFENKDSDTAKKNATG